MEQLLSDKHYDITESNAVIDSQSVVESHTETSTTSQPLAVEAIATGETQPKMNKLRALGYSALVGAGAYIALKSGSLDSLGHIGEQNGTEIQTVLPLLLSAQTGMMHQASRYFKRDKYDDEHPSTDK